MANIAYHRMTDAELAERHGELESRANDPNTPNWWKVRRECDDCQAEIERRRKGKEWAAGYFGGRRGKGHGMKSGDIPDPQV